jgi:hypothetical protein
VFFLQAWLHLLSSDGQNAGQALVLLRSLLRLRSELRLRRSELRLRG